MQNTHYQTRHPRGSTPHQEMQQGFDRWVRGLRSIEQDPKGSQRRGGRGELTTQEPGPRQAEGSQAGRQWDERGRWDDDGGVSA
jgi:hypothetical protein